MICNVTAILPNGERRGGYPVYRAKPPMPGDRYYFDGQAFTAAKVLEAEGQDPPVYFVVLEQATINEKPVKTGQKQQI